MRTMQSNDPAPAAISPDAPPGAATDGSSGVTEGAETAARAAGRGGLALAAAKISFIVFGFLQQLVLPRLLSVAGYGEVALVLSAVSVVNNVVVAMAIQGVSRAVSTAAPRDVAQVFRRVLVVHVAVAVALAGGFALAAGDIASLASAPRLAPYLRVAALVVLLYGVYAPLVGALNGRRRFFDQAGLDVAYAVVRLVAMVGFAALFLHRGQSGVLGAVVGFVLAAAVIVPVALSRAGWGVPGGAQPALSAYLAFLLPLLLGQSCLNLLMQTDLLLLSRYVGEAAGPSDAGVQLANTLRGVYRGAQLFAFLPYQLLMSITFVLFPMLARASAEGDREAVRRYTQTGVRVALLLTGLMCGAIAGVAPHVLRLVFPEAIWQGGGGALRVLSLGMGAFTVLGVCSAALTSLGRAVASWLLTAMGVVLIASGCAVLVPRAQLGPAMLEAAATAVALALTVTAALAAVVLSRVAGGFVAARTLLRTLAALAAALVVGTRLPWLGKPAVLAEVALVAVVYVAVLVGLRELGPADLARVKQVLGRSRA